MLRLEDVFAEITAAETVTFGGKAYRVSNCCAASQNGFLKINLHLMAEETPELTILCEIKEHPELIGLRNILQSTGRK